MARKRSRSLRLGAVTPVSCTKPTYGSVMSGDIVGAIVQFAFIGVGAGIGYVASYKDPKAMLLGAGVGLVAGVYPSLVAQRAVTRSSDCTQPGLGALFAYNAGKAALAGVAGSVSKNAFPNNKWLPAATSTAIFFGAPLAGKAIIKT